LKHWRRTNQGVVSLVVGFNGLLCLHTLCTDPWVGTSWHSWWALIGAMFIPLALAILWQVSIRSARFVVVGAGLVALAHRRKSGLKSYPLDGIEGARVGGDESLILRIAGQEHCLAKFPTHRHEAEECADFINAQIAQLKADARP
jgi:hypothetical protein